MSDKRNKIHPALKTLGIQFWASIPLKAKDDVAGTLVLAGRNFDMLTPSEAELVESFGKQVNTALSNARLFGLLRRSEEQYHDLFENAPDTYLTINRQRVIVSRNRTGEVMLGAPRKILLGRTFEQLFVPDHSPGVREKLETMFGTGVANRRCKANTVRSTSLFSWPLAGMQKRGAKR